MSDQPSAASPYRAEEIDKIKAGILNVLRRLEEMALEGRADGVVIMLTGSEGVTVQLAGAMDNVRALGTISVAQLIIQSQIIQGGIKNSPNGLGT